MIIHFLLRSYIINIALLIKTFLMFGFYVEVSRTQTVSMEASVPAVGRVWASEVISSGIQLSCESFVRYERNAIYRYVARELTRSVGQHCLFLATGRLGVACHVIPLDQLSSSL